MAIEAVCSCGRLVRFDRPPVDGLGRCPDCNAVITIDNDLSISSTITDMPVANEAPMAPSGGPPGTVRKPLWELMARNQIQPEFSKPAAELPVEPPSEPPIEPPGAVTLEADYDPDATVLPTAPAGPSSGRKGLWSVMQIPAAAAGSRDKPGAPSAAENPEGPILIESVPTPGSPGLKSEIPIPKSQISTPPSPVSPSDSPPDSFASLIDIAADADLLSAKRRTAGFQAANSRRAVTAAVLGGLSIPLSGLALINAGWSRLPATALGFVAILTGLIATQEIQRSGGRKTGRRQAITGIVTGIVGTFLGPLVIAPLAPRKGR